MPTKEEMYSFSFLIEDIARIKRVEYMEAILLHCEETGLEVELAASLITPALKAKITEEAERNNLIKKTNRLPI